MALRAERAAYRAQAGRGADGARPRRRLGQAWCSSSRTCQQGATASTPVIRDFSTRIVRGDRVGLIGPNGSRQDDAAAAAAWASWSPTPARCGTARGWRSPTSISSASSSIRNARLPRASPTATRLRSNGAAAARARLPRRLPVSAANARASPVQVAVRRRTQPAAAGAAVRAAGQRAGDGRADQRPGHRDARAARGADRLASTAPCCSSRTIASSSTTSSRAPWPSRATAGSSSTSAGMRTICRQSAVRLKRDAARQPEAAGTGCQW